MAGTDIRQGCFVCEQTRCDDVACRVSEGSRAYAPHLPDKCRRVCMAGRSDGDGRRGSIRGGTASDRTMTGTLLTTGCFTPALAETRWRLSAVSSSPLWQMGHCNRGTILKLSIGSAACPSRNLVMRSLFAAPLSPGCLPKRMPYPRLRRCTHGIGRSTRPSGCHRTVSEGR